MPESAQVYRSTTVQSIIQQSHFLSIEFKIFIEELLSESPCGNLRRAQGFLREARALKAKVPSDVFKRTVIMAIADMKRFNQVRVEKFKNYMLEQYELIVELPEQDQIKRNQNNPMLRKNNTYVH